MKLERYKDLNMNRDRVIKFVSGGILAGACIGSAATIYLKVGGVVGSVMFAFGLIVVVAMKLPLFTGQAQHVWSRRGEEYSLLGLMLLLNIAGCLTISMLTCNAELTAASEKIITTRLERGPLMCGLLSIPCGFIMTAAVRGAGMKGNWLPLLFGVPAFIICGFPHCVADSFYYVSCSREFVAANGLSLLAAYLPTVLGNYLGCNAYRLTIGMPAWFTPLTDETASTRASEDEQATASANPTVNADNPDLAEQ